MKSKSKETPRPGTSPATGSLPSASENHGAIRLYPNQPASSWRRDWPLALLLVIVTMVAYLPAWNGTPIWDDDAHLTKQDLRSLDGLARIWTQPGATPHYL